MNILGEYGRDVLWDDIDIDFPYCYESWMDDIFSKRMRFSTMRFNLYSQIFEYKF